MVFFVLEAHRALYFSSGVDERTQRITGQRVIVAAGIDVLEPASLVKMALGVGALEQETFYLVSSVECVALLLVQFVGVILEHATNVAGIRTTALVDDFTKHQNFAGAENVGRRPVECAPIDSEAQIALALRGEAANRGTIKGQVIPALEQELLVVIEHVQPAFEVAEQHGDGLDPLLVS